MTEVDLSFLSPRMRDLIERSGGNIPGVGHVEIPSNEGQQTVEAQVPQAAETEDKKKERGQINQDLDLVLQRVPNEVRSNIEKYHEFKKNEKNAVDRLKEKGVDVDAYLREGSKIGTPEGNVEFGKRKGVLRRIVAKMRAGEDLADEEQEIVDIVGLKKDTVETPKKDTEKQEEGQRKSVTEERRTPQGGSEVSTGGKIRSEADVREAMRRIEQYTDPSFRARALMALAQEAHKIGSDPGLINEIVNLSEVNKAAKAEKAAEVPGLPEKSDSAGWMKWGRERLAQYLDPSIDQTLSFKGGNPFTVEKETLFGKSYVNGLLYCSDEIKEKIEKELKTVVELRQMFSKWKNNHENIKNLVNEDNEQFPSNELMGSILNGLEGENGVEGGGAKKIARVIALYWRMSSLYEGQRSNLSSRPGGNDGLPREVQSIFNSVLSEREEADIRKMIADSCGGNYYEALGYILAKFMGVGARGADSLKSGIKEVDCLGKLFHTRGPNYWASEGERQNPGKRADRWLPDEMCNMFLEMNENSKNYDHHLDGGRIRELRIAVDIAKLQEKGKLGERTFYLVESPNGQYRVVKELALGEVDSGKTIKDLIENGGLDRINWKDSSFELMTALKKRNNKSLKLYDMLRETITPGSSLDPSVDTLKSKKTIIDGALGQYGNRTKEWVGYLYLESWLRRHSRSVLQRMYGVKAEEVEKNFWNHKKMNQYIDNAVSAGLVSELGAKRLKDNFKTRE